MAVLSSAAKLRIISMVSLFLLVNTQRRNNTSPSLFVGADRAMRQPVAGTIDYWQSGGHAYPIFVIFRLCWEFEKKS